MKPSSQSPVKHKRTLWVWVLILGFLALSIYGWSRMIYSWLNVYWLNFAGVRPGPVYLQMTGALWGLIGLIAVVWVYRQRNGFQVIGTIAALLMALMYWADRILYNRAGGSAPNTLFAVLMTILLLAYTGLVLRPFPELSKMMWGYKKRGSDVEIRARD